MSAVRRARIQGRCACGAPWQAAADAGARPACPACGAGPAPLHGEALAPDGSLLGCLACGHDQLYHARDFPRALGLGIVAAAAVLAPFTAYVSLFVAAAADAILAWRVPRRLHCYRCGAVHRGFPAAAEWPPFDLEVADVHRYGPKAAVVRTLGQGHSPPRSRRRDGRSLPAPGQESAEAP